MAAATPSLIIYSTASAALLAMASACSSSSAENRLSTCCTNRSPRRRPMPSRTRVNASVPIRSIIDASPRWPPLLPPGRIRMRPSSKSASSSTTTSAPVAQHVTHRPTAVIHERSGLDQQYILIPDQRGCRLGPEPPTPSQGARPTARQLVHDAKTDVVRRTLVLPARVSQADDDLHVMPRVMLPLPPCASHRSLRAPCFRLPRLPLRPLQRPYQHAASSPRPRLLQDRSK